MPSNARCASGQGAASQVIVDHCSFFWATDENLSVSGPRFNGDGAGAWRCNTSHQITFSHNLICEGPANSVHKKDEHSKGSLIHANASGIVLYASLDASNMERNALFRGGALAAVVNDLIYTANRARVPPPVSKLNYPWLLMPGPGHATPSTSSGCPTWPRGATRSSTPRSEMPKAILTARPTRRPVSTSTRCSGTSSA